MTSLSQLSTGSSAAAQTGLTNAFADVNTLSNIATGSTLRRFGNNWWYT